LADRPAAHIVLADDDEATRLVLGRVLVYSDSDLSSAYDLSKQIQLTPLSGWRPN